MFGVHAHAMSLMTVAKIRKVYNRVDGKSIAKQLGMSAHENATPIRILHNSAGHLNGAARSFGAILMGYLGKKCLVFLKIYFLFACCIYINIWAWVITGFQREK